MAAGTLLGMAVLLAACADSPAPMSCPSEACQCVSAQCTCEEQASCTWIGGPDTGCDASGGSCSFTCDQGATCTGSCSGSCSADCRADAVCDLTTGASGSISCEGAECTVTLGNSGSISCGAGATCHVTCTEQCSVSCSESTCDLRCAGDTAAHAVSGSGSCP